LAARKLKARVSGCPDPENKDFKELCTLDLGGLRREIAAISVDLRIAAF
jgi:hypothetical protein